MNTAPWWTAADDAELDVLVNELVRSFFDHRERGCKACADSLPCPHLNEAVGTVEDWRRARDLLSRAEFLRAERDAMGKAIGVAA